MNSFKGTAINVLANEVAAEFTLKTEQDFIIMSVLYHEDQDRKKGLICYGL